MTAPVSPYHALRRRITALCEGETDAVALMATIVCELYHAFDYFDWVGFYRRVGDGILKIGPYQGGHGCLAIPFDRGVCGKCAREKQIQNVPDVNAVPDHIACSSTTRSELVIPVVGANGELVAVLDIDSDTADAFNADDEQHLQAICESIAGQ